MAEQVPAEGETPKAAENKAAETIYGDEQSTPPAGAETAPAASAETAETPAVTLTAEEIAHRESSRAGRKAKALEAKLAAIQAENDLLKAGRVVPAVTAQEADPVEEANRQFVRETIARDHQRTKAIADHYLASYNKHIADKDPGGDEALHNEIVTRMFRDFKYTRQWPIAQRTADSNARAAMAATDAELNYQAARAAVLADKHGITGAPKRAQVSAAPAGPAATSSKPAAKAETVKLTDPDSIKLYQYLKRAGSKIPDRFSVTA